MADRLAAARDRTQNMAEMASRFTDARAEHHCALEEIEGERDFRSWSITGELEDGMSESREYRPIACGLHDRLEAHATIGGVVTIVARDPDGTRLTLEDRLVDVFARDGEEFVRTGRGRLIRLDRLESVDGVTFRRSEEAAQPDGGGR